MLRSLSSYELLHPIGVGGMATVHLARTRGMAGFERLVAIKCCHPHLRGLEGFLEMFLDEARLAAMIRHPNVVATVDVVDDGDRLGIVMEYVEGASLAQLSRAAEKSGQRMALGVALRIVVDMLAGLHAAHGLRDLDGNSIELVHRDVSPQNVMVGVDGIARLTDFGIARAVVRAAVTSEGELKGKLSYMAPELFRRRPATRRSDVYAAGVVVWEALTGERLFRGENEAELVDQILRVIPPPPSTRTSGVPADLDAVVARALARDPEKRFGTAAEFAEALEGAGVRLESARVVGEYVTQLCGHAIKQPRAAVADAPAPADATVLEREPPVLETNGAVVTFAETARSPVLSGELRGSSSRRLSRVWLSAFVAAPLVIVAGVGLYLSSHRRPSGEAPAMAAALPAVANLAESSEPITIAPAAALPVPSEVPTGVRAQPHQGGHKNLPVKRSDAGSPSAPPRGRAFHPTEL